MVTPAFSFQRALGSIAALLLAALLQPPVAAALDVTSCAQVVPARQTGELVADLTCTEGIRLDSGATLELRGHSITGPGGSTAGCLLPACGGVWCRGARCTVHGPGEIRDFPVGVFHHGATGASTHGLVLASGITISGNGTGVSAAALKLQDATISESVGGALSAQAARLERVTITGNGTSVVNFTIVAAGRLIAEDTHVDANLGLGPAIVTGACRAERLTVVGNAGSGFEGSRSVRLRESTLTGNAPVDLKSHLRPHLQDTVCDHSSDGVGGDWNVCTLD